ncbi:C4-dicarboxylate ABC transporter permease, partial [Synergistaceae bacterium OttesenSCG-928-I11]|nr:C4-dicarboxylate ABC transporter permease [Synergistaceae bacterium OttesenSCG-928-I11]
MQDKESNIPAAAESGARERISSTEVPQEDIQKLIEKYDAESRYRNLRGLSGKFIGAWLAAMSLFHLYTAGITAMPIVIQRAIHLTFAIVAVYILFPATQRGSKDKTPWYDWLLALAAGCVIGYIALFFNDIARRGANPHP